MLQAKIIVIAMLSLLMTAAALAQPAQKNIHTGNVVSKPRPKDWSFGCSNPTAVGNQRTRSQKPHSRVNAATGMIGGSGGAVLGVQKPRTRQER